MLLQWMDVARCEFRIAARIVTAAVLLLGLSGSAVRADFPKLGHTRAERREAVQAIPWSKLTPEAGRRLKSVIDRASLYRSMPAETISCDPDLYVFLVRHPEVVVNIWRHMGITKCSLERTKQYVMQASDGAGTKSTVELIYGTSSLHVMYAEGEYTGSLTRQPIRGKCVIVLRSDWQQGAKKTAADTKITSRMHVFLQLDHKGAEVIAKALLPIVGPTVDQNFKQTVAFVGQIASVAKSNRDGMQRLALQLDKLDRNVRDEFAVLTARVSAAQSSPSGARTNNGATALNED